MEILYFKSLESTQIYLKDKIKNKDLSIPIAVVTEEQTSGIGSRDNQWVSKKGDLFISFAISTNVLPKDLNLSSVSIYFSFIMKSVIAKFDSNISLKWPNDLYLNSCKVGGVVTTLIDNIIICGIGINLVDHKDESVGFLDIDITPTNLAKIYLKEVEKFPTWKHIFSEYKIEFENSREYYTNINNSYISLKEAILQEDGSILLDGQKVYSLR